MLSATDLIGINFIILIVLFTNRRQYYAFCDDRIMTSFSQLAFSFLKYQEYKKDAPVSHFIFELRFNLTSPELTEVLLI